MNVRFVRPTVERKRNAQLSIILMVAVTTVSCDVVKQQYPTAALARASGAEQRGLLPTFVPDRASNVTIAHDVDTNDVWIRCTLDQQALTQLRSKVRAVGWSEARTNTKTPPWWFGSWNPVLGGTLTYTPPAGTLYFVFGQGDEWHGIASSSGECWIARRSAV